jgi:Transposase IS116/IS110/IS902 family
MCDARLGADAAATAATPGASATEAHGTGAQARPGAGQVGSDRCARHRQSRPQRAAPRLAAARGGTSARVELLVDYRDDLVDERRRCQQRLRRHLHELDPSLRVPLGALDRTVWLERLSRQLAGRQQTTQVRIARQLRVRCRGLSRSIGELDRELHAQTTALAPRLLELPGCAALTAAKLLCEIGPIDRFRSDAQLTRHAGVAPLDASSGKHQRHRHDRGGNRQLNPALHRIAITQGRVHAPAKAPRTQTSRRQKPPQSTPLPQTPTRPHRLHHPQKRAPIDIGATLTQPTDLSPDAGERLRAAGTMVTPQAAKIGGRSSTA